MLSGPVIIPLGHLPPSQSLSHALEYPTEPICRNASMFTFVSFLKLFFCKKKNSSQIIQSRSFAALLLPPPTSPFSGIVCFCVFFLQCSHHSCILKSNGEKIIQRAYFSQKKTSPIFNFSPKKIADFDFQIDENFSFQRPASQQNCLYVSCDDSK